MRYGTVMGALALAAGLGLAVPTTAAAQDPVQEPPQPQQQVEVTDDLLDRFVAVYPEVVNVAQVAQTQLAVVETAEEAQEIQQEAQQEIQALLQEEEVTVAEYEAVVMRLNEDPEFRADFEERLAEAQGGGGL